MAGLLERLPAAAGGADGGLVAAVEQQGTDLEGLQPIGGPACTGPLSSFAALVTPAS